MARPTQMRLRMVTNWNLNNHNSKIPMTRDHAVRVHQTHQVSDVGCSMKATHELIYYIFVGKSPYINVAYIHYTS